MKINPVYSYTNFKTPQRGRVKEAGFAASSSMTGGKTDTITLSPEFMQQKGVGSVANSVVQELNQPTDSSRLESIRAAVLDKTYYVSSDELTDSILNRALGR